MRCRLWAAGKAQRAGDFVGAGWGVCHAVGARPARLGIGVGVRVPTSGQSVRMMGEAEHRVARAGAVPEWNRVRVGVPFCTFRVVANGRPDAGRRVKWGAEAGMGAGTMRRDGLIRR